MHFPRLWSERILHLVATSSASIDPGDRPARILLTGLPGVGKTTVILRLLDGLPSHIRVAGFHTAEIRESGERVGFRVAALAGGSAVLSHVGLRGGPRVGRYVVDVDAFEGLVLPELSRPANLVVLDEIGKMECFSRRFAEAIRRLLGGPVPLVATVAIRGTGLIAEVKARDDVVIETVTRASRDGLPEKIRAALRLRP